MNQITAVNLIEDLIFYKYCLFVDSLLSSHLNRLSRIKGKAEKKKHEQKRQIKKAKSRRTEELIRKEQVEEGKRRSKEQNFPRRRESKGTKANKGETEKEDRKE